MSELKNSSILRYGLTQFATLELVANCNESINANNTSDSNDIVEKADTSMFLYVRDLLTFSLIYPHMLIELKNVENITEKIENLTGVFPNRKIATLFSEMIQCFGFSDGDSGVSEEQEFLDILYNPEYWENPCEIPVQGDKIEYLLGAAGLKDFICSLKTVLCLDYCTLLNINTLYLISSIWTMLVKPKTGGVGIEPLINLKSQIPVIREAFRNAKPSHSQEDFSYQAKIEMENFFGRAFSKPNNSLEHFIKEPTSTNFRNSFGLINVTEKGLNLTDGYADRLAFLETIWWALKDTPYLYILFDRVRSRLPPDHTLNSSSVISQALFPNVMPKILEISGLSFSQLLMNFKLKTKNLTISEIYNMNWRS